ncbi:hypothetical protein FNV43_RR24528 [Rhamnella rubrinervis]|uniref:Uncharacterized protein n=1 Tax=Rhamnella rubrinervis TaxID=2594499 RepID=A0A8K0DRD0_9ROSA|nr:hypothetical protein FNV43_RR24528 [Rhamnella rubrinervis]
MPNTTVNLQKVRKSVEAFGGTGMVPAKEPPTLKSANRLWALECVQAQSGCSSQFVQLAQHFQASPLGPRALLLSKSDSSAHSSILGLTSPAQWEFCLYSQPPSHQAKVTYYHCGSVTEPFSNALRHIAKIQTPP